MGEKSYINTLFNIDFQKNLDWLNVGQVVEITGTMSDIYIGEILEIDLEAKGFWISYETQNEDLVEWLFQDKTFFYAIDIKQLKVLS